MAEMKIAIAEDNRQALDMLGNILESDKEIQVVGKAENGTDAYNMIVKTKPDIVFLDVVDAGNGWNFGYGAASRQIRTVQLTLPLL